MLLKGGSTAEREGGMIWIWIWISGTSTSTRKGKRKRKRKDTGRPGVDWRNDAHMGDRGRFLPDGSEASPKMASGAVSAHRSVV